MELVIKTFLLKIVINDIDPLSNYQLWSSRYFCNEITDRTANRPCHPNSFSIDRNK